MVICTTIYNNHQLTVTKLTQTDLITKRVFHCSDFDGVTKLMNLFSIFENQLIVLVIYQ